MDEREKKEDRAADVIDLRQRRLERATGLALFISFEGRPGECSCADFVLGFEAGQLRARLQDGPETWAGTYHATNLVMIERIAEASGYEVTTAPTEVETWVAVDFTRKASKPER